MTAPTGRRPGPITMTAVAVLYALCVAVATWPVVATFSTALPSHIDALAHLWTMRWYKTCLIEGRSPFLCPELQYPVGVPLGFFPPMHVQSLVYVPLSFFISNDVLIYNLIWLGSLVLTGLGTFVLAWYIVRDIPCAVVGGMLGMLGTPVLNHAHGHLEMIQVGFFPLFLVAWMRLIDAPSRGRLLAAIGLYVLTAMSAPYYFLFSAIPAAFYVPWRFGGEPHRLAFVKSRGKAVGLFCLAVGPVLLGLFSSQVWAATHGFPMARPKSQFEAYGAPWWSYFLPTGQQPLGKILPINSHGVPGLSGECYSYLGLVTWLLLHRAGVFRARFSRSGFFWAGFATLVVLSFGAKWQIGSYSGTLPAAWLRTVVPPFRVVRVPARFNIFAMVFAAVIAAAGLRHWLDSVPNRTRRAALIGALGLVALWDLSSVPFGTETIPPIPPCYAELRRLDPSGAILDAPHLGYAGAHSLPSSCGYWQSIHGGKTSSGYSAGTNSPGDYLATWTNPLFIGYLMNPAYPPEPGQAQVDVVGGLDFLSYTWLFLHEHDFRFVVLHQWPGASAGFPVHFERLKTALGPFPDPGRLVHGGL